MLKLYHKKRKSGEKLYRFLKKIRKKILELVKSAIGKGLKSKNLPKKYHIRQE